MSMAVKSVSFAELAAYSVTVMGPVTSTPLSSGSVAYRSVSGRSKNSVWSKLPAGMPVKGWKVPPLVGLGFRGSYSKRSTGSWPEGFSVLSVPFPQVLAPPSL